MGDPGGPRRPLDWNEVRTRLERTRRAAEARANLSAERARAVLEARARALAREPAPSRGDELQLITLRLSGERYAIEPSALHGVIRLTQHTPVPGTPPSVRGVINLRGEVLALFDLRPFLGLPLQPLGEHTRVLVLGAPTPELGLVADEIEGLVRVPVAALHPPAGPGIERREWLRGVTEEGLMVLDGQALLGDRRLALDLGHPHEEHR
jgi:purine-binding chemotaxis protein CheW